MPVLNNQRHERFARLLFEGMTADAAYVDAGYKPSRSAAARLSANESIRARVAELQAAAAERAEVTVDSIARQLDEDRFMARAERQAGAAIMATMGKAKLYGLITDKVAATITPVRVSSAEAREQVKEIFGVAGNDAAHRAAAAR